MGRRNPGKLSRLQYELLFERQRAAMLVVNHVGRDERVLLLSHVVAPSREMLEAQLARRGLSGQE